MKKWLPGGFRVGQRVKYQHWLRLIQAGDLINHTANLPARSFHRGQIVGYIVINDQFYYIIRCSRSIEFVLPARLISLEPVMDG